MSRDDDFDDGGANVVSGCERLVPRAGTVPAETLVFHPRYWESVTLVDSGLADEMMSAGLDRRLRLR